MEGFIRGSTVHVGSGFIHGGPAGEIDVVTGEAGGIHGAQEDGDDCIHGTRG